MVYAEVDPVITAWVRQHDLKLQTEWANAEARFCYVSGGQQECFQVSVEHPHARKIVVHARSIETIDDAELHEFWLVEIEAFAEALAAAWGQIEAWKKRIKGPATWTPPASWNRPA
jgi:hypothetical protein